MSSIWHNMGIREGKFCGVEQTKFLNTLYRFHYDVLQKSMISLESYYILPSYYDISFDVRAKWNPGGPYGSNMESYVDAICSIHQVPFGTPITQEYWNSAEPKWEEKTLLPTVKDLLGEEKVTYPAVSPGIYGGKKRVGDVAWEKQQYKLVQKMRYCIVPLILEGVGAESKRQGFASWVEWTWDTVQVKIQMPEYWQKADCKIGIYAKVINGIHPTINGCFWVSGKTPYVKEPVADARITTSELRIYGAVDLATHPDFKKFFDGVDK